MNYTDADSALIDEARNRRESTCNICLSGIDFVIDLERMEQRRADAGTEVSTKGSSGGQAQDARRPIRRWQEEWNEDSMLRWNAHIREVYPSWDYQTSEVQDFIVQPDTSDYRKVEKLLFDGSGRLSRETHEICRVVRVQNLVTMSRYENEKRAMSRKRNGGDFARASIRRRLRRACNGRCFWPEINEAYMLHGTRGNSPLRLARSADGFDLDGNPANFYSRAVYFAARSCYSDAAYAHLTADVEGERPDPCGPYRHLIVALVLRGAAKKEPAPWPEEERALPGAARRRLGDDYDSVEGGPHRPLRAGAGADDSVVCAVYKSSQAMAEYVVTYKVRARRGGGGAAGRMPGVG